ncbi:hypothetical protein [Nitrospira lenta]|uniref:Uncharacterized protein n=1 Tax=Nitrospira lenta TaxID=1436998 RepID=A0A330L855_9BACT|nr:hypothetical protein [Nitrospira lenta]SPP66105.1 hypothetical protein NITLEN_50145 [Nitrospira lenta]
MKSLTPLKTGGFRIVVIAVLSACTTIHPETISQFLGPAEQEKFQQDFAECYEWAESKRPKFSFSDLYGPLSAAFLLVVVGAIVEYKQRLPGQPLPDASPQHGGKALMGFSIAGVAAASGLIVAGMISRQHDADAAMRSCLSARGYTLS